jgi:quinol monooxygenase YgiN
MPVFMTARFKVKPESREKCEQAIREFIDYIKANEPGTMRYTSLQQADDPLSYLHFFIFADKAAREKHSSSAGVQRFTSVLYPELQAPVEFTEYSLVAST